MPEVRATLDFEIADALGQVDVLQAALTDAITTAADAGSSALADSLGGAATGGATQSVQDLGNAAETSATQSRGFEDSLKGVEGAALLATGQVGGMRTVVQGFGASAIPAVAGAVALGGGILALAEKAVAGVSATQRYTTTLGAFAKQVDQIHVGTLNESLDHLSIQMGTVPSATRQAAATVFQFATNAGIAGKEAAGFTSEVVALAARAVALNPALGGINDVIPLMSRGLAVGGRFAQRFGLDLNSGEIAARALADTGKTLNSELTVTEKQMAGAEIASAKYGATLGKTVSEGAKNATLQQRSFRAEIEHFLEVVAKPVVAPFFQAIEAGVPAIEALGKVLATLAVSAFPAIIAAVQIVTPILTVLADVFQTLGPLITIALDAFIAFKVVGLIAPLLGAVAEGALAVGIALPAVETGALGAATGIEALSVAMETNPIGIFIAAAAAAAVAIGLFGNKSKDVTVDVQKLSKATTDAGAASIEAAAAVNAWQNNTSVASEALKQLRDVGDQNIGTMTRLGQALVDAGIITQTQFNKALADASRGQQQFATDTQNATTSLEVQQQAISDLASSITATVPTLGGTFQNFHSAVVSAFHVEPSVGQFIANLQATVGETERWIASIRVLLFKGLTGLAALVESQGPHVGLGLVHQINQESPAAQKAQSAQIDALGQAITKQGPAVKSLATDTSTAIVNALKAPLGPLVKAGHDAGHDYIAAMASGVTNNTGLLTTAVTKAVTAAKVAAASAAHGSPRLFTYYLGKDLMHEMAAGIAAVPPPVAGAVAGSASGGAAGVAGVPPGGLQVIVLKDWAEAETLGYVPSGTGNQAAFLTGGAR